VTEHVAVAVVPLNVHVPENVPLPLVVNVTVPVGGMKVPGELSVTVTLHWIATPTVAGDVQVIAAVTDLPPVTVTVAVASGLAAECPASPP
jgi:hypothetical protein